jgi:hypothetical protein
VVVVRAETGTAYGEIIIGIDNSAECEPALAYAFE